MFYEPYRDVEKKVSLIRYENVNAKMHFHKSIELIYVTIGEIFVKVGCNSATLKAGEILFVPSYFAHSVEAEGETQSYTLIIPENYTKSVFLHSEMNYFLLKDQEVNLEIFEIFKRIEEEQKQEGLLLQGLIFQVLGLIEKHYSTEQLVKNDDFAIRVIRYVQENFREPITLEEISRNFGYSKYYFSHKFNEIFGCNLKTYINRIRFDNVMESDREQNMTEKILSAGFNTISAFYKMKKGKALENGSSEDQKIEKNA